MSFPRYPAYKDSGVEWLGEVPAAWVVTVIKRFSTLQRGHDLTDAQRTEGHYPVVTSGGVSGTHGSYMARGPGVVTGRYGSTGRLFYIEVDYWPHNTALYVSDFHGNIPRFVWYFLQSVDFGAHSAKAAVPGIDRNDIHPLPVAVPPASDQARIASFLDRETARIDALVAEQERLIELLREKRQAVISHAVTKGLDPNVPMKDSGIDWIGQVPVHWRCVRNKAVFQEVDERSDSDSGELLTVSHITGVTRRSEKDVNMILAETLEGYKMCREGDLVINTMWAWMGALGCSPLDGLVSPSYNVYRPRAQRELLPSYYDYLCRVPSHRTAMKARSSGVWESRLRLYPDAFLDMRLVVPPIEEQGAIVAFLSAETARWDALLTEAERAITLLQERRSALITAAVTGQIDVRGAA